MRTNQAELNSIIERFSYGFREYIDLESPIENIEDCVRNMSIAIALGHLLLHMGYLTDAED